MRKASLFIFLALAALSCVDQPTQQGARVQAQGVEERAGAAPHDRLRQGATLGTRGAVMGPEAHAMILLLQVVDVAEAALPDVDAALDAMDAAVDERRAEMKIVAETLREQREALDGKKEKGARLRRLRKQLRHYVVRYQERLANLELAADDAQLLRLNAIIKSFTAPIYED